MLVYSIYDKVAQEAGPLFTAKNHDVALRNYNQLMLAQKLNRFDYKLICLGDFETDPVRLIAYDVPVDVDTPSPVDVPDAQG